ncbi:addiction module antidote protein, HigA family [Enterococcus faecium]|nr:addiction module antidote protein, HigA family [Enterococcus faecium]
MPLSLSVNALAKALDVPATLLHAIVYGQRSISADTAARLARHSGGDAAPRLAMQAAYDLKTLPTRSEIERRVQPRAA